MTRLRRSRVVLRTERGGHAPLPTGFAGRTPPPWVRVWTAAAVAALALALALPGCKGDAPTSPSAATTAAPATASKANTPKVLADKPAIKAAVEARAMAILKAYRAKDVATLAELGPPDAKEKLIFIQPDNPNYAKLLGDDSWRMKALKAWDGTLKGIRIGPQVAQVYFHDLEGDQVAAVELLLRDGAWIFHDLIQQPRIRYKGAAPKGS